MTLPSSRLRGIVASRAFAVTSEVVPPRSADPSSLAAQARQLVGYADAVNVTDNPTASVHMSPVAGAAIVARAGLEPTLQLTVRDRNRLALVADLLGAWALGARNVLCLTGDPLAVGEHPEAAAVNDLTVLELVETVVALRETSRLPGGREIDPAPRYLVGVADSPLAERYDPARLDVKLDAGADLVMTQIVYDVDALEAWADVMRARGVPERAAVLVGVASLRSARQARYVDEHLPGVSVPPAMIAELADAGEDAAAIGAERCAAIVRRLREVPGVAGVHVMGFGREEAVRQVIERSGLLPRPSPRHA